MALVDGGGCVSDLKVLRDQADLFGQVASQPTAWRVLGSIDGALLAGLQAARAASRARVWAAGLAPSTLTLDLDASLVDLHTEKERAAPTYKRGLGLHPLLAFLRRDGRGAGLQAAAGLGGGQHRR